MGNGASIMANKATSIGPVDLSGALHQRDAKKIRNLMKQYSDNTKLNLTGNFIHDMKEDQLKAIYNTNLKVIILGEEDYKTLTEKNGRLLLDIFKNVTIIYQGISDTGNNLNTIFTTNSQLTGKSFTLTEQTFKAFFPDIDNTYNVTQQDSNDAGKQTKDEAPVSIQLLRT